jgi:cystathionine gamma-synthase
MANNSQWHDETLAVNLGRPAHAPGMAVNVPIGVSTTFVAGDSDHGYIRDGSAGTEAFEQTLGALEHGHTVSFSSGIATVNAMIDTLPPGAVVVSPNHAYPGTVHRLREFAAAGRIQLREVLISDTQAVAAAAEGADLLWLETPTNPLMEVADIKAAVAVAKANNAQVVVDNTFMSPSRQRPIDLGADVSMHSATKSIAGHSDALIGTLSTRNPELAVELKKRRMLHGTQPGSLETFLALRGLRTLHIRMDRAEYNAGIIAERLASNSAIEKVYYVGLPDDVGHDLHFSQATGAGTVVCFVPRGNVETAEMICSSTKLWTHATSLGGVESTLERRHRWSAESPDTPQTLIRLSVGIENVEDLWSDLEQAIAVSQ